VAVGAATNEAKILDNREIPGLHHVVGVMLLDKTASFKSAQDIARMKHPAGAGSDCARAQNSDLQQVIAENF
jgi:hypothetical protein